jgi:hypothetical protein
MGMIEGGVDAEKENLTYFEWYRRDSPVAVSEIDEDIELDD